MLDDDRHALEAEGEDEPSALLERVGFRMRPLKLELADDEQDFQATMAYQGAFAYVYLADRSTCTSAGATCDWSRAPRLEEDVLPVVRDAMHVLDACKGTVLPDDFCDSFSCVIHARSLIGHQRGGE